MINELKLELKDVGPIANAVLDINKINIIGGQNSTGKSTASKLFYCFLKANSSNRDKLVAPSLLEALEKFYLSLRFYNNDSYSLSELVQKTRRTREFIKNRHYDNFEDLLEWFEEIGILFEEFIASDKKSKGFLSSNVQSNDNPKKKLIEDFNKVKRIIQIVEEESNEFFKEVMEQLLFSELEIEFPSEFDNAKLSGSSNAVFSFDVNFKEYKFESNGKFNIGHVFYLESFSIFDNYLSSDFDSEHVSDLKEHLFPKKLPSKMFDDESMKILEEIVSDVVGGRIIKKEGELKFVSKGSKYTSSMKNTASGIKQIAVIQSLLRNRFLGDNSVLIIDEPEVNLHPEWQIKLARILVLLAKEGDITLYINSHSPMFIEAMDTFSEYYDFEEYVNYYLSEKSDDEEYRFNFNQIPSDELYLIYDNLGDPYDYLDRVRLSKGRKEGNDDFDF